MSTRDAHLCTCGHRRAMHSAEALDMYVCLVVGCRCKVFERAVAGTLHEAEHVRQSRGRKR